MGALMTTPTQEGNAMATFDTPQPIITVIDVGHATISVEAGDRADTVVEVRPSDSYNEADVEAAQHIHVDYDGGRLLVRTDREQSGWVPGFGLAFDKLVASPSNWARSLVLGPGSVDVTISLPAGSRLDAKSDGSIRCRGPLGEVRYTTSYGDIQVEQAGRLQLKSTYGGISVSRSTGHAEVTSTHGDIHLGEIDGTAAVKTSHGEVRIREVTGELRLSSAHGDVTVDRALAGVAAKTAYGSVRIGEASSGSIVMETTGGGLDLGVRLGTAAWLDVSSKYGTVDVSLDTSAGPAESDQVIEVRAHTSYGDIDIHRS
jgi:Putative adhesin